MTSEEREAIVATLDDIALRAKRLEVAMSRLEIRLDRLGRRIARAAR